VGACAGATAPAPAPPKGTTAAMRRLLPALLLTLGTLAGVQGNAAGAALGADGAPVTVAPVTTENKAKQGGIRTAPDTTENKAKQGVPAFAHSGQSPDTALGRKLGRPKTVPALTPPATTRWAKTPQVIFNLSPKYGVGVARTAGGPAYDAVLPPRRHTWQQFQWTSAEAYFLRAGWCAQLWYKPIGASHDQWLYWYSVDSGVTGAKQFIVSTNLDYGVRILWPGRC